MPRARTVGLIGAKGGVGVSTLVVNLAAAVAQHLAQADKGERAEQICIVDLRAGWGSVALLLGQKPQGGWGALVEYSAETLSRETVENHCVTHASGLRFLPATPLSSGAPDFPAGVVEAVLQHLVEVSEYLFLDLGNALNDTVRQAISYCDILMVVVEPEPLCITMTQSLLGEIKTLDPTPKDIRVVAVERFAEDASFSMDEMGQALEIPVAEIIQPAVELARRAAKQGTPLVLLEPAAPVAEQIQELARSLLT